MNPLRCLLVCLAAASLALAGAADAADRPDSRLDAAASSLSGRSVTVYCETSWDVWVYNMWELFGVDGTLISGFAHYEAATTYVNPRTCETLHALLNHEDVGTYYAASALLTFAHESVHQRGVVGEGEADCAALTLLVDLAVTHFGVPPTAYEVYSAVKRRKVPGQKVRVNGRVVRTKARYIKVEVVRYREVENPWLTRLATDAMRWHRAKPPEYQGTC